MLSHQIIKSLLKCNEEGGKKKSHFEESTDDLGVFIQQLLTHKRTKYISSAFQINHMNVLLSWDLRLGDVRKPGRLLARDGT